MINETFNEADVERMKQESRRRERLSLLEREKEYHSGYYVLHPKKVEKQLNTHFEPFKHAYPPPEVKEDGSEVHHFKFCVQRGILDRRMSGLELAQFVVQHMGAILGMGLLSSHPDINFELGVLYNRLLMWPPDKLDELLPWIQVEWHTEDHDFIHLNLDAKKFFCQKSAPIYSIPI